MTYDGATVAVVVPAYNESGLVGGVIETVPDYVDRVYVVEDGSTDDTWDEIRVTARRINAEATSEGAFDRRVVPIRHEENRGVGGAIKTGYLAARDDRIDVTAVMGGDAQMRPELLAGVIDPIVADEADYVKGNRLLNADHREGMPRFRYVGNRILTWLTRIASGYWTIGDPQNGYTAISLHALETAGIEEMYEYYGYCNDLLVRCNVAGLRVMDIPRPANYGEEESHIDYRSYVPKVSVMLFRGSSGGSGANTSGRTPTRWSGSTPPAPRVRCMPPAERFAARGRADWDGLRWCSSLPGCVSSPPWRSTGATTPRSTGAVRRSSGRSRPSRSRRPPPQSNRTRETADRRADAGTTGVPYPRCRGHTLAITMTGPPFVRM
ncbi:glycosyltransferase family 2 protein [Halomicroarcula sp. GCM10025894]|uniref:glycosyltransferase family 2 protein n=1 Tax=Halomicroarcula sp. GCM10025894 TaxID=3252673 RepID=UPI0036127233